MHSLNPNSNEPRWGDVDLTDDCKNQCLQYLLNELEPDQITLFEEKLCNSERVADELQRQAEMIVKLSEVAAVSEASAKNGTPITVPHIHRRSHNFVVKAVWIALAVCIGGLAFRTWWSTTKPSQEQEAANDNLAGLLIENDATTATVSEFTLIARAWAASQMEKDRSELADSTPTGTDVQFINTVGDELEWHQEEAEGNSEEAFSWMFTAAIEIHEVETNDG